MALSNKKLQQKRNKANAKAKARKANAGKANAGKSTFKTFKNLDLLTHLWGLVDDCQEHVTTVIKGVVNSSITMPENRTLFIQNASNNKTSEQASLAYQFGQGYYTFKPFHIGKTKDCSVALCLEVFEEFINNPDAVVSPCLYVDKVNKTVAQSMGYMGKKGNISIQPMVEPDTGRTTTFITVIPAEICSIVDFTGKAA